MDIEQIKKILPHRYPFLLIDKVIKAEKNYVCAVKNVSINEPHFTGHFPQVSIMPGVLQVEAMAQAAGVMLAVSGDFDATKQVAFLAGVDDTRFKRVVVPGDQLVIEAKEISQKRGVLKASVEIKVDAHLASSATIILAIKALS